MAGHSQFKNIMHRKGRQDAVRSKLFGKLAREITVAAKLGLPDPGMNPRLRAAIIAARAENMTKDTIERAIKKALGGDAENYDEIRYEGYGPGGVAVIVEVLTDNRNRTAGEVRATFTKHGGNLAETNAVAWMFTKRGYIVVPKSKAKEDDLMAVVIDAGGDDLRDDEDNWEVLSAPEAFPQVLEAVKKLGIEPDAAEISMLPQNYLKLEGKQAQQMVRLMEALDDHDDVRHVWSNFDIEEKEIEASLA